jgi:hypothetical protein
MAINSLLNPSLETQQKLGNYAGYSWTLGNVLLPAYTAYKITSDFLQSGQLDLSAFTNEPYATTGTAIFIGSSIIQSKSGEDTNGTFWSQAIGTVGYTFMLAHSIETQQSPLAILFGAGLGIACTAYNAYKLYQKKKDTAQEKLALFAENTASIFKKFPMLTGALPILISSGVICISSLLKTDPERLMAAAAFSWAVGDICFGLSAPQNKDPNPLYSKP